jgi:DNA-binding Lrp family transcriptional regulator
MTVFWDVSLAEITNDSVFIAACTANANICLMMEAVSTTETVVNFYQTTWRSIPEDIHLHTRRREKLKYHHILVRLILHGEDDDDHVDGTTLCL